MPIIAHTAALWSLVHYPSRETEWDISRKLEAVKKAGFDAIAASLTPEIGKCAADLGLECVGFDSANDPAAFASALETQRDCGAHHVNVQLADHDTPVEVSIDLAVRLIAEGKRLGVEPSVEVHRDTCTETPEKTYAIADGYQRATGELLPMTWDYSHLAVVKHLAPPYAARLLERPNLVQRSQQLHLRPFNGHHCQVPVTNGRGELTPEIKDWLEFARELLQLWIKGNQDEMRKLYLVPEMGPVAGGYNLGMLPNSWEEAKVLRSLIDDIWLQAASA
jgi:sugar phosphate isomerase/epimerase